MFTCSRRHATQPTPSATTLRCTETTRRASHFPQGLQLRSGFCCFTSGIKITRERAQLLPNAAWERAHSSRLGMGTGTSSACELSLWGGRQIALASSSANENENQIHTHTHTQSGTARFGRNVGAQTRSVRALRRDE